MSRRARDPLGQLAGVLVALGCFGSALEWASDTRRAATVYLAAFGFLASSVLGALILQMSMRACAARWFVALRRLCESIAGCDLLVPLAFLPVAFTLASIYPWARNPNGLSQLERESFEHAARWLAPRPFLLRSLGCFVFWLGLSELLRRGSLAEDRGRRAGREHSLRALAAGGLPLLALVASLSLIDWLSTLTFGWVSSLLALRVLVGGFGAGLGALAVAFHVARRLDLLPARVGAAHAHALGRLLLTSTALWAYLAVSELIIVWSANLPREAAFYAPRWQGGARGVSLALLFGHFALPFLLLLSRSLKRRSSSVAWVGAWLCVMHALDCYWLVVPSASARVSALDGAPFLGLSGLAVWLGRLRFRRAPILPARDPELERSLSYESP